MIFSTKAVTQLFTSALTFAVSAVIARLGFHTDPAVTAEIPGIIAMVAGALSAFFVREEGLLAPTVEKLDAEAKNSLNVVNERLRKLESELPGPARLAAQMATTDVEADVSQAVKDAVTDLPVVVAQLSTGDVKGAEATAVEDTKTEEQLQVAKLEQQLRDLGVNPDTGAAL